MIISLYCMATCMDGQPGERVTLCEDGVYRWVHEKSLYRDLSILKLVMKIFLVIGLFFWLFYLAVEAFDGNLESSFVDVTVMCLGIILLMMALSIAGYFLYALMMGGYYCVLFEMDDRGVLHAQQQRQVKKAQLISDITILAGLVAGSPTTVGVGINSSRTKMYTKFNSVRDLKVDRKHNTIHVNSNQLYVMDDDLDMVWNYLLEHCTKAKNISP